PAIDITSFGDIGMSYVRSGTDSRNDFMSVYVTGRNHNDAAGTMKAPVLVRAGDSNNTSGREGDFSGINVDADGSFWIANEFATANSGATEVAHFDVFWHGPPVAQDLSNFATGYNRTLTVPAAYGLVALNPDPRAVAHGPRFVHPDGSFIF